MADPRREMVRAGYDKLAGSFAEWGARVEGDPRDGFLEEFLELLPPTGSVLDLGCGGGIPSTKRLAEASRVIGADISEAQIALARLNVPDATFIHADLLDLSFPAASFDGVTAFYSISHVPREDHWRVFSLVRRWLRPGGVFLAALGVNDTPGWTGEWLGVPMFFSSHGADENLRLLAGAGLEVVRAEEVSMREPEGEATFLWAICRHPGQLAAPSAGGRSKSPSR